MMTKQAELKKQAYESSLKSRALSVLIYLIDRSNKDLTCFPAISTMAEQLHISVSTVKRALHELVQAGFIKKESRFRDKNRGQTSNLYTLILFPPISSPDNDNNLNNEDDIDTTAKFVTASATHITFETLQAEHQEQTAEELSAEVTEQPHKAENKVICKCTAPIQTISLKLLSIYRTVVSTKEKAGHFLICNFYFYRWTGVGVNLIPP